MKTKIKMVLFVIAVLFVSTITAQKNDYSTYAGYVDFGDLSQFETGDQVTEVLIEEHLIRMVAKLSKHEEPELEEVLNGLKLIRVHVFETNEANTKAINERIKTFDKKLMANNWDRIVKTRSNSESANVYIKTKNEEEIQGLVVMFFNNGSEAGFVNIVGDINLDTIGKLSSKFDIPSLNSVKKYKDEDHEN
ncbi:MAG: DUF4252 domain-containing protein [Melioribacteraceae bacterium]|nr:DUF4252 domain-containing protein [Melioribacteraceae bacterium]